MCLLPICGVIVQTVSIFIFNMIIFPSTFTLLHAPYSSDTFFFLIYQTDAKTDISLPTFSSKTPATLCLMRKSFNRRIERLNWLTEKKRTG